MDIRSVPNSSCHICFVEIPRSCAMSQFSYSIFTDWHIFLKTGGKKVRVEWRKWVGEKMEKMK